MNKIGKVTLLSLMNFILNNCNCVYKDKCTANRYTTEELFFVILFEKLKQNKHVDFKYNDLNLTLCSLKKYYIFLKGTERNSSF